MRNSQKGFTLVEVMMAMAITAVILTVITTALSQVMSISWSGHKRMDAIKQVENALFVINRDAQVASSISTASPGNWLVFTMTDNSTVTYKIVDPGNSAPLYLQRIEGNSSSSIARYINNASGMTSCSYNGSLLSVKVTSTLAGLGSATETRQMMIYPRLNQSSH
jgi:prepilin-type N-terminal cleavage/methylation domain-containing protein